jgi:hypothetical protein
MTDAQAKTAAGTISPDAPNAKIVGEVLTLHEQATNGRQGWDSHWQALGAYCQPRKAFVTENRQTQSPDGSKEGALFDSTAIQANMTLASGHMSWMTPAESLWFAFEAPQEFADDDEVRGWFHACSRIAARVLARGTNFYPEIQETYLDRGCFGTSALFVGPSKRGGLHFRNEEIGSYSILEDCEGYVDTLIREVEMTYKQAYQEYGDDCAPEMLKKYHAEPQKNLVATIKVIQATFPRMERDYNSIASSQKPVASIHVDATHKHLLRNSGYDEMPYAVSRYLKWGSAAYGWSPSWAALPDMRQLNFLAKHLDLLAELSMFPRLLLPAGMKGQIDLRPGGITWMKEGLAADMAPKEWATIADIKQGLEREQQKRDNINKAFHVDLFQMFAQLDRPAQMTAREVAERASEKLIQFSPTFGRLTMELYVPLLRRMFRLMYDQGLFPPVPQQAVRIVGNRIVLPTPEVEFSSRVALAMRQVENVSFLRTMDGLAEVAKIQPTILDHYDWNRIARGMARNEGLPEEWLLPAKVVAQMQQARQQRNAQMEQAQIAESVSGAVSKLGQVPPGSPMAQLLQSNAGRLPGNLLGLPAAA